MATLIFLGALTATSALTLLLCKRKQSAKEEEEEEDKIDSCSEGMCSNEEDLPEVPQCHLYFHNNFDNFPPNQLASIFPHQAPWPHHDDSPFDISPPSLDLIFPVFHFTPHVSHATDDECQYESKNEQDMTSCSSQNFNQSRNISPEHHNHHYQHHNHHHQDEKYHYQTHHFDSRCIAVASDDDSLSGAICSNNNKSNNKNNKNKNKIKKGKTNKHNEATYRYSPLIGAEAKEDINSSNKNIKASLETIITHVSTDKSGIDKKGLFWFLALDHLCVAVMRFHFKFTTHLPLMPVCWIPFYFSVSFFLILFYVCYFFCRHLLYLSLSTSLLIASPLYIIIIPSISSYPSFHRHSYFLFFIFYFLFFFLIIRIIIVNYFLPLLPLPPSFAF